MTLPRDPHDWPEPWRSLYLAEREERIALMVESGQSEHAAVVRDEVQRIEDRMRKAHREART